jgi:hypothetical protein
MGRPHFYFKIISDEFHFLLSLFGICFMLILVNKEKLSVR